MYSKLFKGIIAFATIGLIIIVLVGVAIPVFRLSLNSGQVSGAQANNDIALLLNILGIAVSVWVGLNIYNVFTKEETEKLVSEAREAINNVNSVINQENYASKLRISFSDNMGAFFATQVSEMNDLPKELLAKLIEFQDVYNNQKYEYGHQSTPHELWKNISHGRLLIDDIRNGKYQKVDRADRKFLLGYLYFLEGMMEYSPVQYHIDDNLKIRKKRIADVVSYEKKALKYMFGITSISDTPDPNTFSTDMKKVIAIISNCAGSVYMVAFNTKDARKYLSTKQLEESIQYLRMACTFSGETAARIREVFFRNLGTAYMKKREYDDAYKSYVQAYNEVHNNSKISIGFAELFLEKAMYEFQGVVSDNQERRIFVDWTKYNSLTDDEKSVFSDYMERSLYWYIKNFDSGYIKFHATIFDIIEILTLISPNDDLNYEKRRIGRIIKYTCF